MPDEREDRLEQPVEDIRPDDAVAGHIAKHDFMLSNTVQIGKIVAPEKGDPPKPAAGAFVLVHIGGEKPKTYTRSWMPWLTRRAGRDAEWWKPDLHEQVLILAPSGNLALGVVAGSIYRGSRVYFPEEADLTQSLTDTSAPEHVPAESAEHVHRHIYRDGTTMEYDSNSHSVTYRIKRTHDDKEPSVSVRAGHADDKGSIDITVDQTTIQVTNMLVKITDPNGNTLEMNDSGIRLTSSKKIVLKGGKTTVTVDDNGADVT